MNKQTVHGEAVSEDQIDAWVAEAEAGYDVEMLRKKRQLRAVKARQQYHSLVKY